jgi:hypothetical protein
VRSRVLTDPDGRSWTVKEVPSRHVPGALGEFSLIFDTEMYCRRVWTYPSDGHELADEVLLRVGRVWDAPAPRTPVRRAD